MIPLIDENETESFPIINLLLIGINCAVFLYMVLFFPDRIERLFFQLGFIPYEFSHFEDLQPRNLLPFPLTVFSSMFMHGGWLHLLSNMLYLFIFGDNVEDRLGHGRYLLFYILCGLAATSVHGIVNPNSQIPTVGASGAIAGVLGAYMILFPKARIKTLFIIIYMVRIIRIPAIYLLGYWIAIQVLSAVAKYSHEAGGGIAWFAHIGGFISGLILIFMMKKRKARRTPHR